MARGIIIFLSVLLIPSLAYADPVTIVVAVASAAAAGAGGLILGSAVAFSWAAFGVSLAISALSYVISPKGKGGGYSFDSVKATGSAQQFRQAVTERQLIYGEVRTSGPIVYVTSTDGNKNLHMFIALASHECQEIGEIIVDDVSITADMIAADGLVNAGRYINLMRIRKHLGSDSQISDSYANANIPDWSSNHRLQGIAYIYISLQWNRDIYPNGIPNFSAWVKGRKIFDTRSDTTYWTPNIPLFIRDYLTDTRYGVKAEITSINDDDVDSSANIADEYVLTSSLAISISSVDTTNDILTLSGDVCQFVFGDKVQLTSGTIGGLSSATDYYVTPYQRQGTVRIKLSTSYANALAGTFVNLTSGTTGQLTKIAEPRYHGGGIVKCNVEPASNISEMVLSMAGTVNYSGGKWKILAGSYRTPTVYLDEGDLAGGISVTTKISKQDRFNRIQGVYSAFINSGNTADYPLVKNDIYAADDGEVILKTRDFAFIQRPAMAQRVAKSEMERMRQEISFMAQFKLTAFKVGIADNFYFTFDRYGWGAKVFECVNWKLSVSGTAPVIEMTCREMATSVYDWVAGEETQVDPAPNSTLPNIFDVLQPTSLAVYPVAIETSGTPDTYKFNFVWTPPPDEYVTSGGQFEVQFKESSEADYRPSYFVDGEQTFTDINQVRPVISYDARVRSVNVFGVRSAWASLTGFTVGSPSGVTDREDYGLFSESVTSSLDYGLFSDTVTTSEDYGAFV